MTHHNNAAGSRLRLDLGLDVWAMNVKFLKVNVLSPESASPSTATFNKKDSFHLSYCILFSRNIHDYCITPLLRSESIVNEFISKHVLLWQRANCLRVTICQHRSTVVWDDCAKMTCCIGFFFLFFSLSIYMLLYKQRGLWRRVMKCWR